MAKIKVNISNGEDKTLILTVFSIIIFQIIKLYFRPYLFVYILASLMNNGLQWINGYRFRLSLNSTCLELISLV